jgi:MtN3 and saliva related transmembrane protein
MEIILAIIAGFLTSVWSIPQIYKMYKTKDASGVSVPALWTLVAGLFFWVLYDMSVGLIFAAVITFVGLVLSSIQLILAAYYQETK